MSKHYQKLIKPLVGQFLGWADDRTPHRYLNIATVRGEERVKVAKSLRPQIQDWQPGIWLTLMSQEQICKQTGKRKLKVKQLLTPNQSGIAPSSPQESSLVATESATPTKIQVCQGSSCRRRGSGQICQAMQAYIEAYDLTDRVEIQSVKCLHQCKAAPQAIVTSPASEVLPGKTHYRQIQPDRVAAILAKHFPIKLSSAQAIVTAL
ncbi:(2Fe-2S) ferredoxin domain-containing protein [Chamaesiphon minutus]|uniref:NADH:ubiquinone oxidoreductase 24 kD subunit n=1 Tax=Chamaesiphon minutus (strain ATCC 27169 / PCC 6605) TaxID=1173020 RepID=K9UIM3_CHAP6|nr:(2Fe-2S) ferredoxin domain-containing protein [Chamaesiphon minutus]AFY94266.1 NADH:ubiquinone oxidoreductase 24 kD subunit [Chamaesiphon minutus PCC 6605]